MGDKTKLEPSNDSVSTIRLVDGGVHHQPPSRPCIKTIVKVQLPVVSNIESARALVYNEDRKVMLEVVLTSALRARFQKGEVKAFFHAEVSSYNVEIGDRAPWQKW